MKTGMLPVYIDNSRFEPNPPVPGQPLVFRADVFSFFFDEPQIRWQVELINEDEGLPIKTFGPTEWVDFTEGYLLEAQWDGTDSSGQPVPPATYRANLLVEVREKTKLTREGNPIVVSAVDLARVYTGAKSLAVELSADPASLESGQTASVSLRAFATVRGLEPVPPIHWKTTVFSPSGAELSVYENASGTEEFNSTWEAHAASGSPLPDGVYRVQVTAEIPAEDLQAEATLPFAIGEAHGLSIEGLAIDPDPLEFETQEEGMEGGTVTAELTPVDLTESSPADWTLLIKPSDGAPVRTLTGQVTLAVDPNSEEQQPTHFETFWDGRDEQGQLVEEGDYSLELMVDPCRDGSTECIGSATAPFTVSSTFVLELRDDETDELLATSETQFWQEPFPFIGPLAQIFPPELADAMFLGPKNNEFLFVDPGNTRRVNVFIRTGRISKPERLTIKASLSKSYPNGINLTLGSYVIIAPPIMQGYRSFVTLADTTSDAADQLGIQRGLGQTFSTWDVNSDSMYRGDRFDDYPNWEDSEAVVSLLRGRGWSQYGKASWHDVNKVDMEDIDPEEHYVKTVAPTRDALKAAGYEDLVVRVFFDGKPKKKLWVRVKNEARCLYVSAHGTHDAGKLGGVGPWELTGYWGGNLKLLILAGCSVLDIGKLNDDTICFSCEHTFDTTGYGMQWKALLGQGSVCLGYSASAPLALVSPGIKMDTRIIRRFDSLGGFSADPDTAALDWLKANMAEGGTSLNAQESEQLTACAITDDSFYFIRHRYKETKTEHGLEMLLGAPLTLRQVWKIDKSLWNQLNGHESFETLKSRMTRIYVPEYDIEGGP